ncbi:MAG: transporter substrate-binding domain-containing protein [Curvibacter sp.]|nr:transporter substrate-binding domain-containing protein [Curvibacter sp.]
MLPTRRFLQGLLALACLTTLAGAQAQDSTETALARVTRTKTLRIGAVAGAVPYFNKDLISQKWDGFGPEFAESLARKFGAHVEYVETTWGNAVLDLQSNKIDVMFGMAPTPARREVVGFTDTLFDNTYTVVCKKGLQPKTWAQLNTAETKVAVDIGSSHDQLATRVLTQANVSRLENSGAATMALQAGRADCQILVVLLAEPLLLKRPDVGQMSIPTPVETAPVSIGIRKEADPSFQKAINGWIAEERSKGEVKGVILRNMEKLVGVKPSAFPPEVKF